MEALRRRVALRAESVPPAVIAPVTVATLDLGGLVAAAGGSAASGGPHDTSLDVGGGSSSGGVRPPEPETDDIKGTKRRRRLAALAASASVGDARVVGPTVSELRGPDSHQSSPRPVAPATSGAAGAHEAPGPIVDDVRGTARKRLIASLSAPSSYRDTAPAQALAASREVQSRYKRQRSSAPPRSPSPEVQTRVGFADTQPLPLVVRGRKRHYSSSFSPSPSNRNPP